MAQNVFNRIPVPLLGDLVLGQQGGQNFALFDEAGSIKRELGYAKEETRERNIVDALTDVDAWVQNRYDDFVAINNNARDYYLRRRNAYIGLGESNEDAKKMADKDTEEYRSRLLKIFNDRYPEKIFRSLQEKRLRLNN